MESHTDVSEPPTKHENNPRKRVRHRKKQIYENIMKQMEFYFSDANLSKDRFLGDLVKNDPFVPITEFLKFNKIRSLTQDANDIVKAMKHSTLLELSEDKQKVKRKTPMMPYDADLRTVYVESIPVTASREWLERVFSDYGQVAYISLPKFKNSNKIKGFAFIEFATPQDAQNCMNAFNKMGCKLPSCMPPEELSSIKMFSVDTIEDNPDNQPDNHDNPDKNHDNPPDNIPHVKEEYEPPKKKAKKREKKPPKTLELKQDQESDNEKRTPTEGRNTDVEQESKDEISHDEGKAADSMQRKKKLKKRSSKEKGKAKALAKGEAPKGALWGLQVLPKSEWKSLRNKYLNLQRKFMKDIKTNLRNNKHAYSGIPDPAAPAMDVEPVKYSTQELNSAKNVEPLQKIPGVFVKEVLPEPCLDVRLTKRTIKTNVHVEHVDVKEGQSEVIIRFDSSKAADEYCANSSNRARVLCGAEEQEQWRLAESARSNKRARGRTRLLARAAALSEPPALTPASPQPTHTHIRFDDE
ncbi:la-related protein 7 isoform X2 [Maniola jurtina]|uniref:la-related protein 7 isoform X2 n=1 Tax=Maniola jurtina TaxID=191418 RepID=UPI001E68E1F7|nr:la-related protein 7 isoform X2 [Maniola jurtina]